MKTCYEVRYKYADTWCLDKTFISLEEAQKHFNEMQITYTILELQLEKVTREVVRRIVQGHDYET